MKLFLDNYRIPRDCILYMSPRIGKYNLLYLEDWVIVNNYEEFIERVQRAYNFKEEIDFISFDHLADEYYIDGDKEVLSENYKEKTGYDCAKWLIEFYDKHKLRLPTIFVHSMNPVGTQNIKNLF